jgi:hypothetical protein
MLPVALGSSGSELFSQYRIESPAHRRLRMSIFGNIMSSIFGKSATAQSAGGTDSPASPSGGQSAAQTVDVEKVLTEQAAQKKEKLDWRRSIVDLMKVLDLDSGLSARKELAKELGYTGELSGSAEMNTWLHKQVMQRLAANGGKVPPELAN